MIKKIFILVIGCVCLSSCTPGVYFDIINCSNDNIKVIYEIDNQLLYDGLVSHHEVILKPNQKETIQFSWQQLLNKGVHAKKDYIEIAVYDQIFTVFDIENLRNNVHFSLKDLIQSDIYYDHTGVNSIVYLLRLFCRRE